ncbi:peroxisomal assembly protein [Vermiconidia calcicola]|uniref:Peroxisomal assembly protein n=1 Tax=Vermiconidia calcicola TaxID=1690605 RepID=A0ACC3MA50_9PEZI|nr:peroxisomal assembly protein [Vermiconidia calcicola]
MEPSVSLPRVAESLPFTFTGADLYALCSDAMLKAVTRSARAVDRKVAYISQERHARGQNSISVANFFDHYATDEDTQTSVTEEDFINAKQELAPSVRNTFEGTTKKPEANGRGENSQPSEHAVDGKGPQRQLANGANGQHPTLNGSNRYQSQSKGGAPDEDDDFVIRTDRLSLSNNNNTAVVPPSSKGKGKGKTRDIPVQTNHDDADGADDLYD